ncbi:MAG: TonB-dependent receptor, partial [Bacteroidetes bacterium]|nr:TonB-dependent receptor [Bacteroidota bacterium]
YYRYLPSYEAEVDPVQAAAEEALMKADINKRQVNWEGLYNANRGDLETINNVDGIPGNSITGLRSRYIVGERVINTKRMNFNSVLNTRVSNHADLTIGISNQYQRNHYYQKVNDLLGGDFWMNLNQFAERDYPNNTDAVQNDLNNPNQVVKEGGKYGYNYDIDINRTAIFLQSVFKYRKFDFHVSGEFSVTTFYRVGHVRNGLFPDHSFGESTRYNFDNYAIKGGVTYKINGRNYLFLNGAYLTRAPFFENAFIAPRTRDYVQNDLTNETIQTAEAGYIMNAPNLKIRLTGYYTRFDNGLNVLSFYHDDYRNFVNYALSNIDKLHFGGEFGFEAKVLPGLTVNGAAAVGRYYYNSRQHAIVTIDNSAAVQSEETVYSQNYRVPSTPQEAYSLGLNYRSKKFWYVSLTGSYFDQMWLDFNPIRRTAAAVDGLAKGSDEWNQILAQTKWDPQYTLDFFGGYSYKMPRKYEINHKATYLVFNLGVNNILNNKDIITGGYEQLRFDFQDKDISKFPPKVYYAYGLNYYASVILRF